MPEAARFTRLLPATLAIASTYFWGGLEVQRRAPPVRRGPLVMARHQQASTAFTSEAAVPQNILVVGGAGYVGSHACKALARAGFQPVAFDNLVYGHEWAVRWGPLKRGDLLDGERLARLLRRYRPHAVMHFAAYAYVGESVSDPAKYYRNNVAGTLVLLDAMRAASIDRIVFSSTCATYGHPDRVPIGGDAPQDPVNPYRHSMQMIEQLLRDYGRAYGLRSIALRYFNAAGANAEGEIGEDHEPGTHLIPLVLRAAGDPNRPITVHGTDYPTPDGTCVRGYVHVEDLAAAHILGVGALARRDARPATALERCCRGHRVGLTMAGAACMLTPMIDFHPLSTSAQRRINA